MNVVNAGSRFQVYGEDVKTYKRLPVASYEVCCNPMTGFYLILRPDLTVNEDKVYGNHEVRVNKVLRSFSAVDRNFGIILSGQKGIGKSLFARVLAKKGIENNLPVIMVNDAYPGVADFLSSIEQEVIVIFDEFEKTFGKTEDGNPQDKLLSLFDGLDNGKKLFVITCNEVTKLSSYLLNRPGRFHYHFTINNPTDAEIREYMTDKLAPEYHHNVERVVRFGKTVNVTYDYLRAIAFELNQGYSLEEALADLNITRSNDVFFDMMVTLNDGSVYSTSHINIDMYDAEEVYKRVWGKMNRSITVEFSPSDINFDNDKMILSGDKVTLDTDFDEDDFPGMSKADFTRMRANLKVENITFTRCDYGANTKLSLVI